MGLENVFRLGTIFFSTLSFPFSISLIKGAYTQLKNNNGKNKQTALTLLGLFFFLLLVSIFSLTISFCGLLKIDLPITQLARFRTFIFSFSNFLTSMFFYNISNNKG